jgi:hypothetical protein
MIANKQKHDLSISCSVVECSVLIDDNKEIKARCLSIVTYNFTVLFDRDL